MKTMVALVMAVAVAQSPAAHAATFIEGALAPDRSLARLGWDIPEDDGAGLTGDVSRATPSTKLPDPARSGLLITAVPEPAMWGLMIGGFTLVGISLRSRRTRIQFA